MMKKTILLLLLFIVCLSPAMASAITRMVPDDFASIQDAINASSYGDTVMVKDGTYSENLTLKNGVNVIGEGIGTKLNGGHSGNVVTANDITNAEFSGFWVYYAEYDSQYAGIKISGGSPVISNNRISHNKKRGIQITGGSSAIIRNNVIQYNGDANDTWHDYGIISLHSTPLITNNIIRNNYGSGIYIAWEESDGTRVINNTIVDNDSDGVWCYRSDPIIKNNIITENGTGIAAIYEATPEISYNDVWNNSWKDYRAETGGSAAPGPGDISVDPLFDAGSPGKYYLAEVSPCIDAGDPNPVYSDIDGTRNDMGAWGGGFGSAFSGVSPLASGFIFTSIGKIPVSEITQVGDLIGLANVSPEVHQDLGIHQYNDSPFGGKLWINGLFGTNDSSVRYYQILTAKWNGGTPPPPEDFVLRKDPLTKIKYTINPDGTVTAQRVAVGPLNQYGRRVV